MAIKRKAVLRAPKADKLSKVDMETHDQVEEDIEEDDAEDEAQEEVNEEEAAAKREEEAVAARKKELKSMYMDDLKKLVSDAGLDTGKKEDMIARLLGHEAKIRADLKAKADKTRAAVVQKKEELEGKSILELKELCISAGLKGPLSKPERISKLLAQWQENDGVDKALTQMAIDQRRCDLSSKDSTALLELCDGVGIDPLVKEVMIDRIVKRELEIGRYARPTFGKEEEAEPTLPAKKEADMVEVLLANESKRKQEKEAKMQEEEVAASKRKELKAKSVEELKKMLLAKERELPGKKDDMVEALLAIAAEEQLAAKKKKELMSKPICELKNLLKSRKLEIGGTKGDIVQALLGHEAKLLEESVAYDAKVEEALAKKKEELETKTGSELRELCVTKGLKPGLNKDTRVQALLEGARKDGEVEKTVVNMIREARRGELLSTEKSALRELCEETGADPFVKEVMVERIISYESEVGENVEPPAKKARKSSK